MLNKKRVAELQALGGKHGVDAFVIVPSANLFYLTGFTMGMSERPAFMVVPQQGEPIFFCPAFEAERMRRGTGINHLVTYTDEQGPMSAMQQALASSGIGSKVALEYRACRMLEFDLVFQAAGGFEYVDARPLLAELRMAKDAVEQASMQRAADAVNAMLDGIKEAIKPGVSEVELQAAAVAALERDFPDARPAFITVVSGEKTALPHASSSDKQVQPGELVMADLGAVVDGYVSDITRTFATAPLDKELDMVYDLVLEANRAAKAAVRPGITAEEVDHIARRVITDGGYGQYFTHRTGHGLGLEVHEEPYIVDGNTLPLQVGHTFTVEPGIYLPGKGGVRVEDDVIVTEQGCHSLTSYRHDLRVR